MIDVQWFANGDLEKCIVGNIEPPNIDSPIDCYKSPRNGTQISIDDNTKTLSIIQTMPRGDSKMLVDCCKKIKENLIQLQKGILYPRCKLHHLRIQKHFQNSSLNRLKEPHIHLQRGKLYQ